MKKQGFKIAKTVCFVLVMGTGVIVTSCSKEQESGRMTLKMTDAPTSTYQKVNVEITGAEIQVANQGWVTLPVNAGIYDLLQLQNNVSVVLTEDAKLPAGSVNQLRLILGRDNSVVTASGAVPLKVPSGTESGIKIPVGMVISPDKTTEILLDFDANASVVTAAGGLILKPVITVKSVIQH